MAEALDIVRRNTIGDGLRRAARLWRDKEAIRFGARSWSFVELERGSARVAHRLRALGLANGDRVAAYGRNSDAYLLLFLACCRAGLVHVPINFGLSGSELRYIVEHSGARLIVADEDLAHELAALADVPGLDCGGRFGADAPAARIPEAPAARAPDAAAPGPAGRAAERVDVLAGALDASLPSDGEWPLADTDLAQIIYTSGTTGLPKGGAISHRALMAHYASAIHACDYAAEDRVVWALPLYHAGQIHTFSMPQLLVGATAIVTRGPDPEPTLALLESERINSFFSPPTAWVSLLRHPDFSRRDLGALRKIYYGASIMPVPVLQELRQHLPGVAFYNCYGQSEMGPLATLLRPEEHDARPASAGRPVMYVETRIVDEDMNDVPPDTVGEIVHRSPHLIDGYWNNPEATAEAFKGGWFHSGDLGRMDGEGYLYIVDRIKDVINTGGVLVASREVEDALFRHPSVAEVAVIGLPHPKWIEAITAVVVARRDATVDPQELIAHAKTELAYYKVPKSVLVVDDLPRNASGKILKRELRRQLTGREDLFDFHLGDDDAPAA